MKFICLILTIWMLASCAQAPPVCNCTPAVVTVPETPHQKAVDKINKKKNLGDLKKVQQHLDDLNQKLAPKEN